MHDGKGNTGTLAWEQAHLVSHSRGSAADWPDGTTLIDLSERTLYSNERHSHTFTLIFRKGIRVIPLKSSAIFDAVAEYFSLCS